MLQMVDKKIIEKIGELVGEGMRYVEEMKRHLNVFVKDDLFRGKQQPERSNRRYFPKGRTIKNHMYNATIKSRLSAIDQDNVEEMISLWKNEERRAGDKFYLRPYNEGSADVPTSTDEDHDIDDCEDVIEDEQIVTKAKRQDGRLLFIPQTAWQSRLLARYGQDLSFLDATYKTTKYSLPLDSQRGLCHCRLFYCAGRNNGEHHRSTFHHSTMESSIEASLFYDWPVRRRNKFHRVSFPR